MIRAEGSKRGLDRACKISIARVAMVLWLGSAASSGVSAGERQQPAFVSVESSGPTTTRAFDVTIRTRSDVGIVFCALWPGVEGYPIDWDRAAHDGMSEQIGNGRTEIRFEGVVHGEYALACFHDENANHTLDTNFLGIPSEGTGASNDARGFMGPPSYEAARFPVSDVGPDALTIRIDY